MELAEAIFRSPQISVPLQILEYEDAVVRACICVWASVCDSKQEGRNIAFTRRRKPLTLHRQFYSIKNSDILKFGPTQEWFQLMDREGCVGIYLLKSPDIQATVANLEDFFAIRQLEPLFNSRETWTMEKGPRESKRIVVPFLGPRLPSPPNQGVCGLCGNLVQPDPYRSHERGSDRHA